LAPPKKLYLDDYLFQDDEVVDPDEDEDYVWLKKLSIVISNYG
jgi:hypothetical protein